GGSHSLRMMDHLGYDVAVLGNHDWFSGPGAFLNAIALAQPRMKVMSSSLDLRNYNRSWEFMGAVLPYIIKQAGDARVAFIGASTYELIFDRFLLPVRVHAPFKPVRALSEALKDQVDLIVVVSHNKIAINEEILRQAPEVDVL